VLDLIALHKNNVFRNKKFEFGASRRTAVPAARRADGALRRRAARNLSVCGCGSGADASHSGSGVFTMFVGPCQAVDPIYMY